MDQEKIGNIIKELRKKNNLTQQNLADQLGVTYQAVSKWENGKNIPDIAILKEISKLYNIDIKELLGEEKDKKRNINYYYLLLLIIPLLIVFFNKPNNDFEFKTISSNCGQFKISGSIAYNNKKSSIYISNINYCKDEDKTVYKKIKCYLYEDEHEIYESEELGKNVILTDYLEHVTFNIDEYNLKCKNHLDEKLYLKIIATTNDNLTKTFKGPLTLNNNRKK